MPRLRYGRIAYVNVAPVETAFDAGALARDVDVVQAVPSRLNAMLAAGELDVAAISAAHFLDSGDAYERVGDLCIAADGPVRSVLFVSPAPPALLGQRTIAVTSHSASGRGLLEAILAAFPGVTPRYEVVDDALAAARAGRPALVIGDDALVARAELPPAMVHDLGEAWHDWTGLPFVFAVWAVRREVLAARPVEVAALAETRPAEVAAFAAVMSESRAWGLQHRAAVIDAAIARRPFHRALYADYFTRLTYVLDDRARAGLDRFDALGREARILEETLRAAR